MTDRSREWEDLTPEQQAALVEFGNRLAEGMRNLADAFNQLTAAAVETSRNIEALTAVRDGAAFVLDGDIPWTVTDDPIMTGEPYHDHGDDGPCGPECATTTTGEPL